MVSIILNVMTDIRRATFGVLTTVVLFGTAYSTLYGTYLNTSDPLLAHLQHPLSHTNYFARKSNILNVYFIKKAWGWTTLLFFTNWLTSPPQTRTVNRVLRWILATSIWATFTMWFFGPSLLDRALVASGGACMVHLPSGDLLTVPTEMCYTRTLVSPSTHPHFFATIQDISFDWTALPRLRRGHDISGHIFLLTLSTLFLVDQLRPSLRVHHWTLNHKLAVSANVLLITIWLLASYTTSVYFHSPMEKITGYILGSLGFLFTQTVF